MYNLRPTTDCECFTSFSIQFINLFPDPILFKMHSFYSYVFLLQQILW